MVIALKTSTNILLVFLFMACTSVPDERMTSYADFPETRELTARTLSLDSALFRYPYRVRIQDDKAVVLDLHGTEYFFMLFIIPTFIICPLSANEAMLPKRCFQPKNFDGMGTFCGYLIPISLN